MDSVKDVQYDHSHDDDNDTEQFDGEVLEAMGIPMLCKASGGSNHSRKILRSGKKMYVFCLFSSYVTCAMLDSLLLVLMCPQNIPCIA